MPGVPHLWEAATVATSRHGATVTSHETKAGTVGWAEVRRVPWGWRFTQPFTSPTLAFLCVTDLLAFWHSQMRKLRPSGVKSSPLIIQKVAVPRPVSVTPRLDSTVVSD